MKNICIQHIQSLLLCGEDDNKPYKSGAAMKTLERIDGAFVLIEGGKITDFGAMAEFDKQRLGQGEWELIDGTGRIVFPTFVDSHTHIVYAGSRESEFIDRLNGLSYEEIARRGGGILNSAKRLQNTSEEALFESAQARLFEVIGLGTGAIEIKSGYGLTLEDELKMLRVIKKLKEISPIPIKATFLGAHAFPKNYSREEYLELILEKMIPQVAAEGLAEYCDVFCDRGFFTVSETRAILKKGHEYGLIPKIHANELDFSGGVQIGVEQNALSVDHLECVGKEEIKLLAESKTMPTLLPSTAFFLGIDYAPARNMIDAGLAVALASDYNPGSSPSGNMSFVLSLACLKMKMTPEEALNAATINSAYAMGMTQTHGRIRKGKPASLILTKPMPSFAFLPYSFGSDLIERVLIEGAWY
ncbi:MAG: imidazolonepropionase [Bernardetiaceae bacterium]|nr:imidazolonepropionase [Bernardetiaceae bacterium]